MVGRSGRSGGRKTAKRPARPDQLWYYQCPRCRYVGVVVTSKPYTNCGMCRDRFGLRYNMVDKARYDRAYGVDEV